MSTVNIPEEFVTRQQLMDPQTEDVIRGTDLKQGMIVIVEGTLMRERDIPSDIDPYRAARYKEVNRWCRVTDLHIRGDQVSFVGVYSDGVKISRNYNLSWFWVVKNESK